MPVFKVSCTFASGGTVTCEFSTLTDALFYINERCYRVGDSASIEVTRG